MDFSLSYSGSPGNLSATLMEGGRTIATETGLKDKKAVEKWASRESRDHKVANTPEATASHAVSVYGSSTFSL